MSPLDQFFKIRNLAMIRSSRAGTGTIIPQLRLLWPKKSLCSPNRRILESAITWAQRQLELDPTVKVSCEGKYTQSSPKLHSYIIAIEVILTSPLGRTATMTFPVHAQ